MMLKVNNLCKNINNKPLLKSINMNVEEGMIYGFIGHNGAGKTTTMRSIVGLTRFNSGEIIIGGNSYSQKVTIDNMVGYLPEDPSFYKYMSAVEYLMYLGQFKKSTKAIELIESVGLIKAKKKKIAAYSRGMKQRLGMAAAMINSPKLLIMDEPTSALDPAGRVELFNLIKKLRDKGSTIILSTHILDDIEKISDRIGIIADGEMLREDTVESILADYYHPIYEVKLLDDQVVDLSYFKQISWIQEVKQEGHILSIVVDDVNKIKTQVVKILAGSGLDIIGFDLRRPTLEDVFTKEISL